MSITPEGGGPTAQAGIYFQNCITSLRLARMLCRDDFGNSALGHVVQVRTEAPGHVDDTVVKYSSNRVEYIQAKMDIRQNSVVWKDLWTYFYDQYSSASFNSDREGDFITLAVKGSNRIQTLKDLLARAKTSHTKEEWEQRLTNPQKALKKNILTTLTARQKKIDEESLFRFCQRISVWQSFFESDPTETDTFENEVRRILASKVEPLGTIFSVLMSLTGDAARFKGSWDYEQLKARLEGQKIRVIETPVETSVSPPLPKSRNSILNCAKVKNANFGDIVGTYIEGAGTGQDFLTGDVELLNYAELEDVTAKNIYGRKIIQTPKSEKKRGLKGK